MIKDISSEEQCFGICLTSFLTQDGLKSKAHAAPEVTVSHPPLLFTSNHLVTQLEFFAFVKAIVGVSSVLVVLAWADSIGDDSLRERTLAVLRLWQNAEGYSEVIEIRSCF
jgi:hypothetical protein